jgi:hypothetical protein
MITLTPCVQCGQMLSPEAIKCTNPDCNNPKPFFVQPVCAICKKPSADGRDHDRCKPGGSLPFPTVIPCPACGKDLGSCLASRRRRDSFARDYQGQEMQPFVPLVACPNCGQPDPIKLGRCGGCGLTFFFAELVHFHDNDKSADASVWGIFCSDCLARAKKKVNRDELGCLVKVLWLPLLIAVILVVLFTQVCR